MSDISNKISIKITADSRDAKTQIDGLVLKLKELKKISSAKSIGLKFNISEKSAENLQKLSNIDALNLQRVAGALKMFGEIKRFPNIPEKLGDRISNIGQAARSISDEDIAKLERLSSAIQSMNGISIPNVSRIGQQSQQSQMPAAVEPKFNASLLTDTASTQIGIQNLISQTSLWKKLGLVAQSVLSRIGSTAKAVAMGGLGIIKSKIDHAAQSFQNIGKKGSKALKAIGRIALYRAIRSAIKAITQSFTEGTKNIYAYSQAAGTALAPNLDSISSNFMKMKNSIGSAVAPLINALTPAINAAINAISSLSDKLAQLFSLISGNSVYSKAIDTTYSFGDAISSSGSAAGSAKKQLDKYTAGVDELNVIDQSDSSSGGGGSGYDATNAFTEATASFGQGLVDLLNEGRFLTIGQELAKKFNAAIDGINFAESGKAIGDKFQSALEFASGFLTTADTSKVGSGIASFINNAYANVNFSMFGSTVSEFWNRVINLVGGFAKELDWNAIGTDLAQYLSGRLKTFDVGALAEAVSSIIKGVLDLFVGFVEEVDWSSLPDAISEKMSDIFGNFDFSGIVSSAFELVGAVIGGLASMLVSSGENIWQDIVSAFNNIGNMTFEGFIDGIVDSGKNIVSWIKDNIFDPFIKGFKKAFGIASPSKEMKEQGGYIIDGLWEGIKEAWHSIPEYFSEKLDMIKKDIKEKWESIKSDAKEKWDGIKTDIGDRWELIKSNASSTAESVRTTVKEKWDSVKSDTSEKWDAIKKHISDKWDEIKGNTSIESDTVSVLIKSAWGTISSETSTQWESIKTNFLNAWGSMKEGIKNPINTIIGFAETLANGVVSMVNKVIDSINSICEVEIPEWVPKIGGTSFSLNLPKVSEVSIPRLENGGFTNADLFLANEDGTPEMVGRIGNRTAVANTEQIIEGIADGVSIANGGVESLLETLIRIVDNKNFSVSVDSRSIGMANEQYDRSRGLYVNRGSFANAY